MKIIDIALKDLLRSFRSLFAVGMMVAAPLLITGLIYFAFGGAGDEQPSMPAVRVGLVNEDAPPTESPFNLGQMMIEMFEDESVSEWLIAVEYPTADAARAAIDRQEIGAAVLIPPDLSAVVLAGERPDTPVIILHDPTLTIGPQVIHDMLSGLLDRVFGSEIAIRVVQERHAAHGLSFDPAQIAPLIEGYQTWYADFQRALSHNSQEAALRLVAPTAVDEAVRPMAQIMGMTMTGQMIFFAFYTGAYSMMSILREQEEGTLARIFTTPTPRWLILAGKFVAVLLTVVVQGLILILVARLAFGIQWGRPGSVALALLGQVVAACGLGVLLIAAVKNTQQAGPVLGGGLTVLGMLGGLFTVGIQGMPEIFETVSLFTPHGWVLRGWELALAGQPAGDLLLPFAITLGVGGMMFIVGAALFRRRFA